MVVSPEVIVTLAPAFAVGAGFNPTNTVDVLVHPLEALVTVTVNVPAAFTVAFAVVPPAEIPVPDQL